MPSYPYTLKQQAEHALVDSRFDFIAKYHAVTDLRSLARKAPHLLDQDTLTAIETLLRSNRFKRVRQGYFLFREAATVMRDIISASKGTGMGDAALTSLRSLLRQTHGSAHRGVAEALGSLPLSIQGPLLSDGAHAHVPAIAWEDLARVHGADLTGHFRYIGRSLVAKTSQENRFVVIKLAKKTDLADTLGNEIRWMEALHDPKYTVDRRFHIPTPLKVQGQPVFRLTHLPMEPPDTVEKHSQGLAIAFVAPGDYFVYPNHHRVHGRTAREMLGRNAYLMGWLAARGVIHDAPIPLFHNRTQRLRRDDQGRYQWFRAGRLDQWLDSCAYPNLGLSGLRDFEHLASFSGESRLLYRHIGSHFLSLLLVAGSHFRCRDISRRGLDANGQPVDARDLFDRGLLTAMIRDIFENYYEGFCGLASPAEVPVDEDLLIDRMIEEMGVDRYMTELLRRTDQQQMSKNQFQNFLRLKNYSDTPIEKIQQGKGDIMINSGPHLGDFNRQISLPELIEAVAAMSAVCIAGRFTTERRNSTG